MKYVVKNIHCSIILGLLVVLLTPVTVMAIDTNEYNSDGFYEITPRFTPYDYLEDVTYQNILCSIFGHKLSRSIVQIIGAKMIDLDQCEIAYIESGFCDRCNEFVEYGRTDRVSHNLKLSANRRYCIYECGYEEWLVR